jgi:hypothetical protein
MMTAKSAEALAVDASLGVTDVDLGPLRGNMGDQSYALPPEIDIGNYRNIAIVSSTLNVVYSIAPISS